MHLYKLNNLQKTNNHLQERIVNIPNILTISRLILVFPLILLLEINNPISVFIIIIVAGLTDYLDGLIARRLNLKTRLGAILDPLSDKVFLLIPLLALCKSNLIPFWSLSLIIFRELIISSLRSTSEDGLPASKLGKLKTLFFFISILLFFVPLKLDIFNNLGLMFYWLGFVLSIITFVDYLRMKKKHV